MTEIQEVPNPLFYNKTCPFIDDKKMIQCNKGPYICKTGKKYVIELPDSKTILFVECTYAAINAADMKILSIYIDGVQKYDKEDYTISYQYKNFDSIHYRSFAYRERCILHVFIDDL